MALYKVLNVKDEVLEAKEDTGTIRGSFMPNYFSEEEKIFGGDKLMLILTFAFHLL